MNMSNEDELIQIDRAGRKMTVVPVREEKDKSFQNCIVKNCLEFMEEDKIPEVDVGFFRIICFSQLFFVLQYPIDLKLIEELAQKRKATFSKVRSLNKTVICFNISMFQPEATQKYKVRSRMRLNTVDEEDSSNSSESEEEDDALEKEEEERLEVTEELRASESDESSEDEIVEDDNRDRPSKYRKLLSLLGE
jgi:hypothetical protein